MRDSNVRVIEGDHDSLVDELGMQLSLAEHERDCLAEENCRLRREVAHLRVELGEEEGRAAA